MSKISIYDVVPVPKLADKLVGTSVGGDPEDLTYNFTLGELLNLFIPNIPGNTLQGVLDFGNTATQNINLTGTVNTTNLTVSATANILNSNLTGQTKITGGLFDRLNSIGTAGQVLTSTGTQVEWYTIPTIIPNLQQVLTAGNTAVNNIILTGNITANNAALLTATISTSLTLLGTLKDGLSSVGAINQVLSSNGTGVRWVNLPVYSAASPLLYNSGTGVFSIQQANASQSGYLSSADWITFDGKQTAISLTTTGSSGPSTLVGSTINVPNYTLSGLGGVPQTRTLTINGVTYNLSADRSWTIAAGVSSVTASSPLFSTGGASPNITIQQSSSSLDGYLSSVDWLAFNDKQAFLAGTGLVKSVAGTISYITDNSANWNTAYNDSIVSAAVTGTATKLLTLNQQDGGTITASWSDIDTGLTSVGVSMPAAFTVTNSPLTSNGTIAITGSGNGLQYIDGTGALQTFPSLTGFVPYTGATGSVNLGAYNLTATSLIKNGGTSGQFLKADGSVDSSAYIVLGSLSASAPLSYNNLTGAFSITQSGTVTDGYLSSTDWNTFNSKQGALTLTTTGTSGASTLIGNTLNIPQYTDQFVGTVTSVGLTMPSAFTVSNSPVTSSGTLTVVGAGLASQYVRGDGTLADFPSSGGGGGSSVSYYLNGSVSQGTIGGVAYRELSKVPILGAGTDISINADGYIASFITDVGDPALLEIPAGNWNFETFFSASSGGGSPTFYVELYKYDGTTFTLIASNSATPELIAFGTNIQPYFSSLAVPQTALTITDRLAVRYYVVHDGRTITLHTENGHLCQIITTFTTGLTALNGLTSQVQYFSTGTSGADFNISSAVATHTFNLPTASAANRGALSSGDWTTFNNKQPAGNYVTTDTTQTITALKTILRGGDVLDFKIGVDTLYGLKIAYNQNELVPSGEATWSFVNTFNRDGTGFSVTPLSFFRGVLVTGERLLSASVNANLLSYYGNNPSGRYPIYAYNTGVQQFQDSILVGFNTGVVNAATGAIASLPAGVVANFNGRVIGSNAVNSNEFATLGQLTGGTVTSVGLTSVTSGVTIGSTPITTSGNITIAIATATASQNGLLSSTDWTTFNSKQGAITLTTTGTSGASTLVGNTLNIPNYTDSFVGTVTSVSFTLGSTGTNLSASVATSTTTPAITLNVPTASASARGALSSTDWTTFNSKQDAITLTTTGTSGAATLVGATLNIPQYQAAGTYVTSVTGTSPIVSSGGTTPAISIPVATTSVNGYLSSTDWTTFNNKQGTITLTTTGTSGAATFSSNTLNIPQYQSVITNPVTGTGTTNYLPKFTGTSSVGNSAFYDGGGFGGFNSTGIASRTFVINAASGRPLVLEMVEFANIHSIYVRPNNSGFNLISSNYISGGVYLPLSLSGRENNADLVLQTGGNVTIGTTTDAGFKLDVNGTGRFSGALTLSVGNNQVRSGNEIRFYRADNLVYTQLYDGGNPAGFILDNRNGNGFDFQSVGTSQFKITSSGNVGIGTASPTSGKLVVSDASSTKIFITGGTTQNGMTWEATGGANQFYLFNGTISAAGWGVYNATTAAFPLFITNGSNVLIGTTVDNGANFQVAGNGIFTRVNDSGSILRLENTGGFGFNFSRSQTTGALSIQGSQVGFNNIILAPTSGNVGIGTTSPVWMLEVNKDTTSGSTGVYPAVSVNNPNANGYGAFYFYQGASQKGGIEYFNGDSTFRIYNNGEKMRITSGGEILVSGTYNPFPATNRGNITLNGSASNIITFTNNSTPRGYIFHTGTNLEIVNATTSGVLQFYTESTERARITSGGNVLIGTTTDNGSKLQVNSAGSGLLTLNSTDSTGVRLSLTSSGTLNGVVALGSNAISGLATTDLALWTRGVMAFETGASGEKMRITSSGNVGIGTASPSRKITVSNPANGDIALFTNTADADLLINLTSGVTLLTPTTSILAFGTSNTERMRISGGNLLIGSTTDNGSKLQVNGAIRTAQPVGTTSNGWLLGRALVSGTSTPDRWIRVQIGLEYYDILAVYMGTL